MMSVTMENVKITASLDRTLKKLKFLLRELASFPTGDVL